MDANGRSRRPRAPLRSIAERWLVVALGSAVVAAGGARARAADIVTGPEGQALDAYLSRLVPFGFAGVVLVARDGEIVLGRGYGLAIEEAAVPNTLETVHSLDSVSKQFTAAAILLLESEGLLETGDRLEDFFEDVPEDKRAITLHQLVTHTSGVIPGTEVYHPDRTREGILRAVFEAPLLFPPGESREYSNLGYSVLAAVVEEVSGRPFDEFLVEELFTPAGMHASGHRDERVRDHVVAHRTARGVDNGSPLDDPYPDWNHLGGGGVVSTAPDLLAWVRALEWGTVLPSASVEKMLTAHAGRYGYGIVVESTERGRLVHHDGGSSDGSASQLRHHRDAGLTLVAFSNRDGEDMLTGNQLHHRLERIAFGGAVPLPPQVGRPDPAVLRDVEGDYRLKDGAVLSLASEGGLLVARATGQSAVDAVLGAPAEDGWRSATEAAAQVLAELHGPTGMRVLGSSFVEHLDRTRAQAQQQLGAFARYEVLGTAPDWRMEDGDRMTFVEMVFERGSRTFRLHWQGSSVAGIGGGGIPGPAVVWFLPAATGEDEFAGYHIPTSRSSRFRLERDPEGAVTAIVFPDDVRARR